MEDCLPIIEPWSLIVEDLIVSNYPNTPGCQNNNIHGERYLQFVLDVSDGINEWNISLSVRTNTVPAVNCKWASLKKMFKRLFLIATRELTVITLQLEILPFQQVSCVESVQYQ
jgi:hypothetical protein